MILRQWNDLPLNMQNKEVHKYYSILQQKKYSLYLKFIFDRVMAMFLLIVLSPIFLVLAAWIKKDSPGEVFFRQTRITQYGETFRIYKFRTMVKNADRVGTLVTTLNDMRVTAVGKKIRRCRLDELPQLINVLKGEMSFVGTRPEVSRYVASYTDQMMATLLLPAGVTSEASIEYKDEDCLLAMSKDTDSTYINMILPKKMEWNLLGVEKFTFFGDLLVMVKTLVKVL